FSDYENLYIHYQFQNRTNTTAAFYTSLVVIKKNLFQRFNGFDERIRIPEDMELGQRLLADGQVINLDKTIQFSHQNHFTLYSYIKKQIKKTSGILKIKLRNIKSGQGNKKCYDASLLFQLGVPISLLIPLNLALSLTFLSLIPLYIAGGIVIFLILSNIKMLFYMYSKRNFSFFIFSSLFLIFNYWMYALGLGYGLTTFLAGKKY
ncbi:MAG: hypothetical protein HZC26_04140, partial [Candidatus Magasanikbacteria bacterium]|nr:hypothetical protein [Candidatus Magasanikbacteria bacterium]